MPSKVRSTIAFLLCVALLATSPGVECWAQAGRVLEINPAGQGPRTSPLSLKLSPLSPQGAAPSLTTPLLNGAPQASLAAPPEPVLPAEIISPEAAASPAAPAPVSASEQSRQAVKAGDAAGRVFDGGDAAKTGTAVAAAAPQAGLLKEIDFAPGRALSAAVKSSFNSLAEDRYWKGGSGKHFRATTQLEILTSGAMRFSAGASIRSPFSGADYPGIDPAIIKNPDFQKMIQELTTRLPESLKKNGLQIGIHQIRTQDGEVVPEGYHRDRQTDYLGIWVANRGNAIGGVTHLAADPEGKTLVLDKTMGPSQLLLFDNNKYWHDVTAIRRVQPDLAPAVRDTFIFAVSPLAAAQSGLDAAARKALIRDLRAEFSKPAPDATRLRAVSRSADKEVQDVFYGEAKRWQRYFGGGHWTRLMAQAPWASHVYIPQLQSLGEIMAQHSKKTKEEVAALVAKVHQADSDFSKAFIEEAEKIQSENLDPDSAASLISDRAIAPVLVEPILKGLLKGKFDRNASLAAMARQLKNTLYLYSDAMTEEKILEILQKGPVQARWNELLDDLEQFLEPQTPIPPSNNSKESAPPQQKEKKKSLMGMGGSAAASLLAMAGLAAFSALTGWGDSLGGAALMLGSIAPMALPGKAPEPAAPTAASAKIFPPYLADLTQQARDGALTPVYLRDEETAAVIRVLDQKQHNNVMLLGEVGIGKTAIAEGLAQKIALGQTGTALDNARVLLLDVGRFVESAAAGGAAGFAAAVTELLGEAADGKTVLVIDEAHRLSRDFDAAALPGSFYDQIKTAMTAGKLKLVLATTEHEYERYLASDPALSSRSTLIRVQPLDPVKAASLLFRIRGRFEAGMPISYAAAKAAVELSVRAFRFSALLRIAIKAMDSAASMVRNRAGQNRARLLQLRQDLLMHLELLRQARADKDLERQEDLLAVLQGLMKEYTEYHRRVQQAEPAAVGRSDVEEALRAEGAPVYALKAGTQEFLDGIDKSLRRNLIGHDDLLTQTVLALKRRFGNPSERKPIFTAFLAGTTGTGKTEYVRALGRALYNVSDVEKSVIKISGTDYMNSGDLWKLVGSAPGYVGHGESETLPDQVRRRPQGAIILVDEAEKMHPSILNYFLSIMEDGSAKDSKGRLVDFTHTIVAFTSNYGVPEDFGTLKDEEISRRIQERLRSAASPFKPEFWSRINLASVFTPLTEAQAKDVVSLKLDQLIERWRQDNGIKVSLADREKLTEAIKKQGYSRVKGARKLNEVIAQKLDDALTRELVAGKLRRGDSAVVEADGAIRPAADAQAARVLSLAPPAANDPLAQTLEGLLSSRPGEPLTLDALDRALAGGMSQPRFPILSPRASLKDFQPDYESKPLVEHRPGAAEPALKEALDRLQKDLAQRPAPWVEEAVKGARALVKKGRLWNLDAALRETDGAHFKNSFFELERMAANDGHKEQAALQGKLKELVKKANREKQSRLSWQVKGDTLRMQVEASSYLPYEEEDTLRTVLEENLSDQKATARISELELAETGAALLKAGGKIGYHGKDGKSYVWIEWPIPAAVAEMPKIEPLPIPEPTPVKAAPVVEAERPKPAATPTEALPEAFKKIRKLTAAEHSQSDYRYDVEIDVRFVPGTAEVRSGYDQRDPAQELLARYGLRMSDQRSRVGGAPGRRALATTGSLEDLLKKVPYLAEDPIVAEIAMTPKDYQALLAQRQAYLENRKKLKVGDRVRIDGQLPDSATLWLIPAPGVSPEALMRKIQESGELKLEPYFDVFDADGVKAVLATLSNENQAGPGLGALLKDPLIDWLGIHPMLASTIEALNSPMAASTPATRPATFPEAFRRRYAALREAMLLAQGIPGDAEALIQLLERHPEAASQSLLNALNWRIEAYIKNTHEANYYNRNGTIRIGNVDVRPRETGSMFQALRRLLELRPDLARPELSERPKSDNGGWTNIWRGLFFDRQKFLDNLEKLDVARRVLLDKDLSGALWIFVDKDLSAERLKTLIETHKLSPDFDSWDAGEFKVLWAAPQTPEDLAAAADALLQDPLVLKIAVHPELAAKMATVSNPIAPSPALADAVYDKASVKRREELREAAALAFDLQAKAGELLAFMDSRPANASASVTRALHQALGTYFRELAYVDSYDGPKPLQSVETVGGKAMPSKKYRDMLLLYEKLIRTRPDLLSIGTARMIEDGLGAIRSRPHGPSNDASIWVIKRLVEIERLAQEKRPDLFSVQTLAPIMTSAQHSKDEVWSMGFRNLLAPFFIGLLVGVAASIGLGVVVLGLTAVAAYLKFWPVVAAATAALTLALALPRHLRLPKLKNFQRALDEQLLQRARERSPRELLGEIAVFDAHAERWKPRLPFRKAFAKLSAQWPEFKDTAEGKIDPEAAQAPDALTLARRLTDTALPNDVLPALARNLKTLVSRPENVSPEIESVLRAALQEHVRKNSHYSSPRLQKALEIYVQAAIARPDLLPAGIEELLKTAFAQKISWKGEYVKDVAAWTRSWLELSAAILDKRPELLSLAQLHSYAPYLRTDKSSYLAGPRFLLALLVIGAIVELVILGISLWHGTASILKTGALAGLTALAFSAYAAWPTQYHGLEKSLGELLIKKARTVPPREALAFFGDYDVERGWFAKAGFKKQFKRLLSEWPEFKAAARQGL